MSLSITWKSFAKFSAKLTFIRLEDGILKAIPYVSNGVEGYKVYGGALYLRDGNEIYKTLFINNGDVRGILPNSKLSESIYYP